MISWLQGQKIEAWQQGLRQGIVIACSSVGYEVQVLPRQLSRINNDELLVLWVHQAQREDGYSLFGFLNKEERDLFRNLIGVNGIGPQIAISLLDQLSVVELVEAITCGDIHSLSKAQGVGARTAERLTVELRNKLSEFIRIPKELDPTTKEEAPSLPSHTSKLNELQETLSNLGYETLEIRRALKAIELEQRSLENLNGRGISQPKDEDTQAWLKASLLWLSKEVA